ncbi:MAG TPA: MoaD/ThiS family protein [Rhodothermales bacterium]|nr:MoaD/ThiS family protein [Rhodothermales bacterium]
MEIEVNLPGLLRESAGGQHALVLDATTLEEALHNLRVRYPLLRIHLYDEQGQVRPHVLIYYNSDNVAWLESLDIPLRSGDQVHVLQAVSGG